MSVYREPEEPGQAQSRRRPAADASGSGAQGIQRVFRLLRTVADAGPNGIRLTQIASRSGLHVATVHRLLRALVDERAVNFDPYARVYHIGYDFLRRAEDARDQRLKAHFAPMLQRLADTTNDVVSLYVRQGLDALCIDAISGPNAAPMPLGTGARRPLGIGAGTIVLLAALPARELEYVLDSNEDRYHRYGGITVKQIRGMLRTYWNNGYAFHPGYVLHGVSGLGIALHGERGEVLAGVAVSAPDERLMPDARAELARIMRVEAAQVGLFPGGTPACE